MSIKKLASIFAVTVGLLLAGSISFAAEQKSDVLISGSVCKHKLSLTLEFNGDTYVGNPKKTCVISMCLSAEEECECEPKEFSGGIDGLALTKEQIEYMFTDTEEPIEIYPGIDISDLLLWGYLLRVDKTGVDNLD